MQIKDYLIEFLDLFGEASLLGKAFYAIVGNGPGETKFSRLLRAAGYEHNAEGFFSELIRQLDRSYSNAPEVIKINGLILPPMLLTAVLEKLIPGETFVSIKNAAQLEALTNITVEEKDRADMQKVIDTYPVRLSTHVIRQMRVSKAVAYQYLPFVGELNPAGVIHTWIGNFHRGLLEQMYHNRAIFLLNMTCPTYCRFCFRKHRESRHQPNPTISEIKDAAEYVRQSPDIKELLLTGGDPFLNKTNLRYAIDELAEIPHVRTLRLATRSVSYYPHLFYADNSEWLTYLKIKNLKLQQKGKQTEIAVHFVHPDEISPKSLAIISELTKNGIRVYNQTPFLNDCNDKGTELTRLFSLLRGAGAENHYIFAPCSPIRGNGVYRTPILKVVTVARYLRAHLSDRAIPRICISAPIGKVEWHSSGWAVERDKDDERYIWVRTPYTPDYFRNFAPGVQDLDRVRLNAEGTLDARYMTDIGDDSLFLGSRTPEIREKKAPDMKALKDIQSIAISDQRCPQSLVHTGSSACFRIHETRAEIDSEASEKDFEYIGTHENITDIVIASEKDAVESLYSIARIVRRLSEFHHVNAVRLRSLKFNYSPEKYSLELIEKLGSMNKLTIVNPLKLEIETQFLHSEEFQPSHALLATALRNKGITVYNNTQLLSGINDFSEEISRIAFRCRESGIEFHHVYIAGLPLQKLWNDKLPKSAWIDTSDVIAIAGCVRRQGSGREIPRYIIRTELGEVDFGLTSRLYNDKGELRIRLLPYSLSYYRQMDPDFSLPEYAKSDENGIPDIPVSGLKKTGDFGL